MLELPAATYDAPHAGLRFELAAPLRLPSSSCLLPRGDNGAGKTTFLEHVFMDRLRATYRMLYLAQDMHLQANTMRATLALLDIPAPLDRIELATAWIRAAGPTDILVLDEFDKYDRAPSAAVFDPAAFAWVVNVTHLDVHPRYRVLEHGFVLHFHPRGAGLVRLELEHVW